MLKKVGPDVEGGVIKVRLIFKPYILTKIFHSRCQSMQAEI